MLERVWVHPWRAWEVMPVVSGFSDSPREAEDTCIPSLSMPRGGALSVPGKASRGATDWEEGHMPQSPLSHQSWGPSLHQAGHTRPDQDAALRTTTLLEGGTYATSLLSHITDTREEKVRNWKRPPQPSGAWQSSPGTQTLAPAPPLTNPWVKQGGLLSQPFFWAGAFGHVQQQTETLQAGYTQVKAESSG